MCPIVSQGHPSNFKVTRDKRSPILSRIERFRTVTPVWIHRELWNDAQSLMGYRRGALLFLKVIHQISRSRGTKTITNFEPNWLFPDCNSSLTSPMDLKWCTKLDVIYKKCPIVFRGHPSNFTVTRAEKSTIWIQFKITRPVAAIKSLRFALFIVNTFMLFSIMRSGNDNTPNPTD